MDSGSSHLPWARRTTDKAGIFLFAFVLPRQNDRRGVVSANAITTRFLQSETFGANVNFWRPLESASFLDPDDVQNIIALRSAAMVERDKSHLE
jgi:hypothetical protein